MVLGQAAPSGVQHWDRARMFAKRSAKKKKLYAEPLATGNEATLAELRDPSCRPQTIQTPVVPLSPEVLNEPCPMPDTLLFANLREARRGSAAGPSHMTNEHLCLLLDDPVISPCSTKHFGWPMRTCWRVLAAARLGRIVALGKPNGRVRALVIGNVFRRLVARALAKHFAEALQAACMPYQFGLSTRAGTEALDKLLQVATECNPRTTVLSVDVVGAFDDVSRQAMLEGLRSRPQLAPLLPFARQFSAAKSATSGSTTLALSTRSCKPRVESKATHSCLRFMQWPNTPPFTLSRPHCSQAKGCLRSWTIPTSSARLSASPPYGALADALWDHALVQLNQRKTRVWNGGGGTPEPRALQPDPSFATDVWVGVWTLPADRQGLVVLGAPLGTEAFVQRQLPHRFRSQDVLLEHIRDLQSAWLTRMLPPHCTADYSREHHHAVASCPRTLLYGEEAPELSADALGTAQLPLGLGGLGLRSATFGASAAYWLPDAFPTLLQRFPADAAQLQAGHNAPHAGMPPALAVACTTRDVREAGLPVPNWSVAAALAAPHPPHGHGHLRGWQRDGWQLVTSARSRHTLLTSTLRLQRCCFRKAVPSQSSPRQPLSPCHPNTSECSFCDGFVYHYP